MARKKFRIPGVSFSYKRALGITTAKHGISRFTGIPTSRTGRRNKMGRMLTGGCLTPFMYVAILIAILFNYVG